MKQIASRITLWYTVIVTLTLTCLFVAGYYLLENHLIQQLDTLNEAQFKHLKAALGPDHPSLTPEVIDARIRETTESASALFYVDMHASMTNRFFKSSNLHGHAIPDIPGAGAFTTYLADVGELRAREFVLPPYDVMIATPMAPLRDVMDGYRKVFLVLLLISLIVSIAVGYGLSQMILKPIRVIEETASRIRSDNLNERIPVGEVKDEISRLARFLNQMFDRLEASFSEIRRFTADASHELKTPLSLVRLHAERLLVSSDLQPAQKEAVHVQLEELARVNQIIDELLFLSRADARAITVEAHEQHPAEFIDVFAQDATVLAEHQGCRFAHSHEGEGSVRFESKRMRQVLLNVVVNALKVSPRGALVKLSSTLQDDLWRVCVEDEGPGLSAEQRQKMFDRFVRFDPLGPNERGSGLGLAISRSIVELHRGKIRAEAGENGRGLRLIIEIPAPQTVAAAPTYALTTAD